MRAFVMIVLLLAPVSTYAQSAFGDVEVASDRELGAAAGRADLNQISQAWNNANVANNAVVGNSQTGKIVFDDNAMQSMSGLAIISANTGNNVAINSSMNVNISIISP